MVRVRTKNLTKTFSEAGKTVEVLRNVSLEILPGQKVGVIGASGVGKSTLLHVLAGLEPPTAGEVWFDEKNLYTLSEAVRSNLRNRQIGFVFQFYHLLPELTTLENVMLPCLIGGFTIKEAKFKASALLERFGLTDRAEHAPRQLSGGEQQRVAIARASVLKPAILFADEPTGNLDGTTGDLVFNYLLKLQAEEKNALILVTHNPKLLDAMDITFELKNGTLQTLS